MSAELEERLQDGGWEIVTSCDAGLAPLFQDGKEFLNIDEQAIVRSLDVLAPGSEGTLTFEAVPVDHPELAGRRPDPAIGIAWHDPGVPANTHILVGVAGEQASRNRSLRERFIANYREVANSLLRRSGLLYTFEPTPRWRDPAEIQDTSVHELRHVADFQKSSLRRRQHAAREGLRGRINFAYFAALTVSSETALLLDSSHAVSNTAVWCAWLAMSLSGMLGAQRLRTVMYRKFNKQSPLERRAYATTATAQSLPPVISLKSVDS